MTMHCDKAWRQYYKTLVGKKCRGQKEEREIAIIFGEEKCNTLATLGIGGTEQSQLHLEMSNGLS